MDWFRKVMSGSKMAGWRRTSGSIAEGSHGRTPREMAHKDARRLLKVELDKEMTATAHDEEGRDA